VSKNIWNEIVFFFRFLRISVYVNILLSIPSSYLLIRCFVCFILLCIRTCGREFPYSMIDTWITRCVKKFDENKTRNGIFENSHVWRFWLVSKRRFRLSLEILWNFELMWHDNNMRWNLTRTLPLPLQMPICLDLEALSQTSFALYK